MSPHLLRKTKAPHQPDNISAGTQVVAHQEVRGTNNSLAHSCGAVNIMTRTPAVAGERFIIRFSDGLEMLLDRLQFEVPKHFKETKIQHFKNR